MTKLLTICPHCACLNNVDRQMTQKKQPVCGKCGKNLKLHDLVGEVDEAGLQKILNHAKVPVVVDFWASWCGPCKAYAPTFKEAAQKLPNAIFLKVNTENSPTISQKLGVRGIPTTIVFKAGKEIRRESGALPLSSLLSLIPRE